MTSHARCAVIWRDFGHYHLARLDSLRAIPQMSVHAVEITSESEYPEFKSEDYLTEVSIHKLRVPRPIDYQSVVKPLGLALDDIKPDVVFVPGWSMVEALVAISWCLRRRVPFVIMSESTIWDAVRAPWKELAKKCIISLASAAFVGGTAHCAYGRKLGLQASKIFIGYDVIDNQHFKSGAINARRGGERLRVELGLPDVYFFCCARLIEKKNLFRLIGAFKSFKEREPAPLWALVIAGPGPLEESLRDHIAALGLQSTCKLIGPKSYQVLPSYYGLASAFILPSLVEQWGLVVNEAMATGLPVIVSQRCGCAIDLVEEGVNGYQVDPYDTQSIADAMWRISSMKDLRPLSLRSEGIISRWSPNRFRTGFQDAAQEALGSNDLPRSVIARFIAMALDLLARRKGL